jgi:hypothetical protein
VNDAYTSVKNKITSIFHPTFDPVTAGPGTTSNVPDKDPNHGALKATDGFKNTYWLAPVPSATVQPELDVSFTSASNLDKIIVRNGASDDFQGHARPEKLTFVYDNGQQDEVTLKNSPDPQTSTSSSRASTSRSPARTWR